MAATTLLSGLRLAVVFIAIFSNLLSPFSGLVGVGALVLNVKRDVWSPHIVDPKATTVWRVGEQVNVTW